VRPAAECLPARIVLLALLFLLPLAPPETRGEAMAGCAALIALGVLACRDEASRGTALWPAVVWTAVLAIPVARAACAPGAAVEPAALAVLALGAGLLAAGQPAERSALQALRALVLASGCVAAHALYQRAWGLAHLAQAFRERVDVPDHRAVVARLESARAFGAFATPAALGGFLALTLPITVALAFASRGRRRAAWTGLALLEIAGLLAAASATAAGALALATLLAALAWLGGRRRLVVAAFASIVLVAGVAVQRGGIVVRWDDPAGPWKLRSGNWRAAWEMAADHPWLGVGPGGFAELYPAYRRPGDNETRHAHDLPLELAAELGWPAAAGVTGMFFWVFIGPLFLERRAGPPWRRGVAVALAAFALQNLADFTAFMPSLLWIAALLRGLMAHRTADLPVPERTRHGSILAGAGIAGILLAAGVAAAAGLAWNARTAARTAAFAGETGRARELAERAARLAPWNPESALASAAAALQAGDAGPALGRAERAVRLSPVRPAARATRARARLATGDLPGAYADLQEAARLYPMAGEYARARDAVLVRLTAFRQGGPEEP
jgi:hypothetical protein